MGGQHVLVFSSWRTKRGAYYYIMTSLFCLKPTETDLNFLSSAILWKYGSILSGYHILLYYAMQCAYEYIKPDFFRMHNTFLFIKCLLQILGLRILGQT